jgi:hypothetical protein
MTRRTDRLIPTPAPETAAIAIATTFVVTQVRHALQHVVASGACSPTFDAV